VAKGRQLAAALGCAACHGEGLHGAGRIAPAIAGRSPSYLARQLYDFQQGTRHGAMAVAMRSVAAKLTASNIVNLTAYAASLSAR
jgi:cytochrome c553